MVNYSKGIIYKLCCNDPSIKEIYVGSTTNFSRRKSHHKFCCMGGNDPRCNFPVYQFIRANGNWDNWSMVLVREYKTTTKLKLKRKERKYIEKLNATLNKQVPMQTYTEYYDKNKQQIIQQNKEYYQQNKEYCKQQHKEYYQQNKQEIQQHKYQKIECECGCVVSRNNMARHYESQKHKRFLNEV